MPKIDFPEWLQFEEPGPEETEGEGLILGLAVAVSLGLPAWGFILWLMDVL